jgi:hypothetical protein
MADDYVLYWGILIGSLAAWLLPCLVAALIAKFYSLPSKFKFALTSAVLNYGITCLFILLQAPLALATNLAPEWAANGHATLANSIASVAEFVGYGVALLPVLLMFLVPIRLRRHWASLLVAVSANNSFKPKPLRGSA